MKNLLFILSLVILNIACHPDQPENIGFTIDAKIENADSSMAYLLTRGDGWEVLDSSLISNGSVQFSGQLGLPEMYYLRIGQSRRNMIPIFLENSDLSVSANFDSLKKAEVSGSSMHDTYKSYKSSLEKYDNDVRKLFEEYREAESEGDMAKMALLDSMYEDMNKEKIAHIKNYAFNNSSNPFGPFLSVNSELSYELTIPEFDELLASFDSLAKSSKYYELLSKKVTIMKSVDIGQVMPAFSQTDTSGNLIQTDLFRGKYLLIDFWASWCGPCRRENPNVVAMYQELKDVGPGFEILGVSLDDDRDAWLGAIEADNLTWPHVSDLKGWSNAVAEQYGVNAIPHTVLVDPEGNIIAHKLRGEELKERLQELLNTDS